MSQTTTDLANAINAANAVTTPGIVTIYLANSITLDSILPVVSLHVGVTLDLVGNGYTLDGSALLFSNTSALAVLSGTVVLENFTIANATAHGWRGFGVGGGGPGLGGGLFVGSQANVTLVSVTFDHDSAIGGDGGYTSGGAPPRDGDPGEPGLGPTIGPGGFTIPGAGGAGGAGGLPRFSTSAPGSGPYPGLGTFGQGGGAGLGGTGGAGGKGGTGGAGGIRHQYTTYTYGPSGTTNPIYHTTAVPGFAGADGGIGLPGQPGTAGKPAGFGGGAGAPGRAGSTGADGAPGQTGQSAPTSCPPGQQTRWGTAGSGGAGGQGGRAGSNGSGGGGGLGAGGDIFVQSGGVLVIEGGTLSNGEATGGFGGPFAQQGAGLGSGIFIQGTQGIAFNPGAGKTLTIADVIADQTGSGGTGANAGAGRVTIGGAGIVHLDAANTFTGGITLAAGTLVLGTAFGAGLGTITFTGDPNLDFTIANAPLNTIAGFAPGDVIDITDLQTTATEATLDPITDKLSIPYTNSGGGTLILQLSGNYTGQHFYLTPDGGTGTSLSVTCFVQGTRILTATGEVVIERLRTGDRVATLDRGLLPVRWIGYRRIDLTRHRDPAVARPIRFLPDSLGDGIPVRELRVSPDHAMLIDGKLIPARLLVNGATILRDWQSDSVIYFHVETMPHSILLAENALSESYLDTGNRGLFENGAAPLILHPDLSGSDGQQQREAQSCRPFMADAAGVEPVWRRLADRAGEMGHVVPAPVIMSDPKPRIIANGRILCPIAARGDRYSFVVPPGCDTVRLLSRASSPCDAAPWVEDRRRLGLLIRRITLREGDRVSAVALDHPHLVEGWWAPEGDRREAWRWTDGDAVLPLGRGGTRLLDIEAGSLGAYVVTPDVLERETGNWSHVSRVA
ncbi:MAG: Hint domain-containing protein [Acetobacteraceae bacterium]